MRKFKWSGIKPTCCDHCHEELEGSFVDGRTIYGPWAILCKTCHATIGCGLGAGRGQKYNLETLEKEEG